MHNFSSMRTFYSFIGTLHAGIGCTELNKVFACLDIPVLTESVYKKYEKEVGCVIEKEAKASCARAASEERKLVILKAKELLKQL